MRVFVLTLLICLVTLSVTPAVSANPSVNKKLTTLDAIWNQVGVVDSYKKKTSNPVASVKHGKVKAQGSKSVASRKVVKQSVQAKSRVVSKQQQPSKQVDKLARLKKQQTIQKLKKQQEAQALKKQREQWRKKWLAQQAQKKRAQQLAQKKQVQQRTAQKKSRQAATPVNHNQKSQQQQLAGKTIQRKKQQLSHQEDKWIARQANLLLAAQQPRKPAVAPRHNVSRKKTGLPARHRTLPATVAASLRGNRMDTSGFSVFVQAVNSNQPFLAYRDKQARTPASVMKLLTSYVGLGVLGPNYRWPIDVLVDGRLQGGVLQGDLIIKGYGDPDFDTEALRKLLREIRKKGVQHIHGRLVFDTSHFKLPRIDAGSFDGNRYSAYNAQPDALLFNDRITEFRVRPVGKNIQVTAVTPANNVKIINKIRRVKRGCRPRISIRNQGKQKVVTFSGHYSKRCGSRTYSRVLTDPANTLYGTIKKYWKTDVGGQFNARFAKEKGSGRARPLLRQYSKTLREILPAIDKDSNNVKSRQVMLTIGAKSFGGEATLEKGAEAMGKWLESRGLHFPELRIENGSGLSRHARISARSLGQLLVDAYKGPYRNVLMESLAIAGVDGTMKQRLRGTPVRGRAFFKTGSLRDVRSIAGYVKARDGQTYVVSIIHNDIRARSRGLIAHDRFIRWVFEGREHMLMAMR